MPTFRSFDELKSHRDRLVPRHDPPLNGSRSILRAGDEWWEEVTPERAKELLAANVKQNRNLSQKVVHQYATHMKEGRWHQTGDAIRIGLDGQLWDGQHRLEAVVRSDTTQRMKLFVISGEMVMEALDQGKKRNLSDILKIRGVPQASVTAGIIRSYYFLRKFEATDAADLCVPNTVFWDTYLEVSPGSWERAAKLAGLTEVRQMRARNCAPAVYIAACENGDREYADNFMDLFSSGDGLKIGNPIFALRKTMKLQAMQKEKTCGQRGRLLMVVKAWNAWLRGDDMQIIKIAGQKFPKIASAA